MPANATYTVAQVAERFGVGEATVLGYGFTAVNFRP